MSGLARHAEISMTTTLPRYRVQPGSVMGNLQRESRLPGASVAGWEWRRKWSLEARGSPGNRLHDAEILIQTHGGQMRREQSAFSHWGPKYSSDTPTSEEWREGVRSEPKAFWKWILNRELSGCEERKIKKTQEISLFCVLRRRTHHLKECFCKHTADSEGTF